MGKEAQTGKWCIWGNFAVKMLLRNLFNVLLTATIYPVHDFIKNFEILKLKLQVNK